MYYIEKDNKIIAYNEDKEIIENVLGQMPYLEVEVQETDRPIIDFQFADTEEYKEEQAQKEREELDKLSLTKREVFLALYKDKGITPEQLKAQITDPEALIEFEYANDYFRGNPLINLIGEKLGYTPDDLDYLFQNGELPTKEEPKEPDTKETKEPDTEPIADDIPERE